MLVPYPLSSHLIRHVTFDASMSYLSRPVFTFGMENLYLLKKLENFSLKQNLIYASTMYDSTLSYESIYIAIKEIFNTI